MVITISAHEIDAGGTGSHTVEHQLDMRLLDVIATLREAGRSQRFAQLCLAFLAVVDAVLFGNGCMGHRMILFLLCSWAETLTSIVGRNLHTGMWSLVRNMVNILCVFAGQTYFFNGSR